MKRLPSNSEDSPFAGTLRHYHRSTPQQASSWEEWVDGKSPQSKRSLKWIRVVVILLALMGLGGIIVGLVIELR